MAVTNSADMYSYLDQLSTQELEALLQKDAEDPDGGDHPEPRPASDCRGSVRAELIKRLPLMH